MPFLRPKTKTKIKGGDRVARLRQALEASKGAYVSIGVHEGAGQYDDGTAVVEVALWNEFGTSDIPERSFIRSTVAEQTTAINELRAEAFRRMAEDAWSPKKALSMIGTQVAIHIQNKIKSNVPPENAKSTRASKEARGVAQRTLIDSGLMLRSITYQVVLPGE